MNTSSKIAIVEIKTFTFCEVTRTDKAKLKSKNM